jgi:autotransporter-associated beta strand protein
VALTLQSNLAWLPAGQELTLTVDASTAAASNGVPLTPDGAVTFYDNGTALASPPLAVVAGEDQSVLDTTTLPPGKQLITVGYTSSSGNYATTGSSPVLTEIIFPANANTLTVDNASSDPTVTGSLPWAVAQADASNAATIINFATASGQAFATPQTITLEAPLNLTDANSIGIEGPSWGVTLVGDYSQSRFPTLSVAQNANILVQGVSIGTQSPGANGDLQVAGVLDVLNAVANLGSAVSVTGGATIDLGGQTVTADSLTLTSGSLSDGTLASGTRTVFSGTVGANLTGSGGLVKEGAGNVVLSGTNTFPGGVQVQAGTLALAAAGAIPSGSSLMVGAGAASLFTGGQTPAMQSAQAHDVVMKSFSTPSSLDDDTAAAFWDSQSTIKHDTIESVVDAVMGRSSFRGSGRA